MDGPGKGNKEKGPPPSKKKKKKKDFGQRAPSKGQRWPARDIFMVGPQEHLVQPILSPLLYNLYGDKSWMGC